MTELFEPNLEEIEAMIKETGTDGRCRKPCRMERVTTPAG